MIDVTAPYLIPHFSPSYRIPTDNAIMAFDKLAQDNSILGIRKIRAMNVLIQRAKQVPGKVAELGVYKGGTARFLACSFPNRPCFFYDTFGGMPVKSEYDVHGIGEFADTTFEAVSSLLSDCPNAFLVKGTFPDSATDNSNFTGVQGFAFVHLDADQYEPTLEGLRYFYPRMNSGGIIVFDDWQWQNCPGVERAAREFMEDKPEQILPSFEYQAYLTKN